MVCTLLLATATYTSAQTGWNNYKNAFQAFVGHDSIVGASTVLVRDGRILDHIDHGFADRARGVRVDSSTLFHWGSITKTLTAISVMQLRDRGQLTLDDRVVDYIPELRQIHNPFGAMDSITIRMLLSHTAGFMAGTWPYGQGRDWEPFEPTRWEQLLAMMPYQEIRFKPGSRYSYSNPGFIYLARIIEKVTGDPWESYVQKNVFAPLGLTRSYFRTTPYYLAANRAHNYSVEPDTISHTLRVIDHGADFDPGVTVPNGGWNAPVLELARYVSSLTSARTELLLKRTSLDEMWQPVQPMREGYPAAPNEWMGLSFFIHGSGDQRVLGHTGHQANFGSFVYFNPTTHTAIITAYNTSNNSAEVKKAGMEAKLQRAAIEALR